MTKWFSWSNSPTYLLDTNVIIDIFHHNTSVAERLAEVGYKSCALSVLTLYELIRGAYNTKSEELFKHEMQRIDIIRRSFTILPLPEDPNLYGREWNRLRNQGTPVDDFDLIIGTTALVNGLILVTNNTKHLSRLEGLALEDWK